MWDLNLEAVENELTLHDDSIRLSDKSPEVHSCNQVAESGTSNSSTVNADGSSNGVGDDDSCSTRATGDFCTLNFGILKMDAARDVTATKDLFPSRNSTVDMKRMDGKYKIWQGQSSSSTKSLTGFSIDQGSGGGAVGTGGLTMVCVQVQQHLTQPQPQQRVKKSRRGPRSRSSQYRGVTYYRRTGRWESHIWDCGKQVYLGGFDTALAAARAYDRAAIRFRGMEADINFNLSDYEEDMKQMKNLTKEEFVHVLRRKSTGFSRGSSKYRRVMLHKCGRWEARMGQFLGKKAHDKAAIKWNGREAVMNFQPSTYEREVKPDQGSEGAYYNLDLNLSISTSSFGNDPKENTRLIQFQSWPYNIQSGTISRMENSANQSEVDPHLQGLVGREGQSSLWNSVYPGLFPNQGRGNGRIAIGASQGLSNWAWEKHGQVTVNPALSPMSMAASSGFSFSGPFPSSSFLLKSSQATANNNICFASLNTAATANSRYLHQLESPQAPP